MMRNGEMRLEDDEKVDAILAEVVDHHLRGEPVNIDAISAAHPELANRIQSRWRIISQIQGQLDKLGPSQAPLATTLHAGSRLSHFEIKRFIGRGGMGIVYEAEQEFPRRKVALKVIIGGPSTDEYAVRLFQREVQALARLQHPAIASIYEAGRTDEGQHFFAMELVCGDPLNSHAQQKQLALRQRLVLFCKTCDAITYAHQRGVIHRDLKPSNILVDDEGKPKVLDFGLARLADGNTMVSTVIAATAPIQGTLPFMSPEQIRGHPEGIDVRSDVYSLGVVLFELLTGSLPFDLQNRTLLDSIRAIQEEQPLKPSRINPALKGDLETVLLKALEKESAKRYQSVSELAEDVQRYLECRPIHARPTGLAARTLKAIRRHPARTLACGASLVVLSLGITIGAFVRAQIHERRKQHIATLRDDASYYIHASTTMMRPMWLQREIDARCEMAESALRGLIELDSNAAWPYLQRGRLHLLLKKNLDEAILDFDRALSLAPNSVAPRALKKVVANTIEGKPTLPSEWEPAWQPWDETDMYFCAQAAELFGDGKRAYEWFSALLDKNPAHYWALLGLELSSGFQGTTEEHISHLLAAQRLRPDLLSSYLNLAITQKIAGHIEDAIKTLKRAHEIAPQEVLVHLGLAEAYEVGSQIQMAEECFRKATESDPGSESLGQLGEFLCRRGRSEACLELLDQAIERSRPLKSISWHIRKSNLLQAEGRVEEARQLLQDALTLDPASAWGRWTLAMLEEKEGNLDRANALLVRAIDLKKAGPTMQYQDYFVDLANIVRRQGNPIGFEMILRQGLSVAESKSNDASNHTSQLRVTLGEWLWTTGRRQEAKDLFFADIHAHPTSSRPYINFAEFWERVGRTDDAIAQYQNAIGLPYDAGNSWDSHCRTQIGRCLASMGRFADAVEQYRLASAFPSVRFSPNVPASESSVLTWARTLLDYAWSADEDELYRSRVKMRGAGDPANRNLRFLAALELCEKALSQPGRSVDAYRLRGKSYAALGELLKALQDYERAFELACLPESQDEHFLVHFERTQILEELCRMLIAEDGSPERAYACCERALRDYPTDSKNQAFVHQVYGQLLLEGGRLQDAEEHLVNACRLRPDMPRHWTTLGMALEAKDEIDEAVTAYLKAYELDPASYAVCLRICQTLCKIAEGPKMGMELVAHWSEKLNRLPMDDWGREDFRAASYYVLIATVFNVKQGDFPKALEQVNLWRRACEAGHIPEGDLIVQLQTLQLTLTAADAAPVIHTAVEVAERRLGENHPTTIEIKQTWTTVLQKSDNRGE